MKPILAENGQNGRVDSNTNLRYGFIGIHKKATLQKGNMYQNEDGGGHRKWLLLTCIPIVVVAVALLLGRNYGLDTTQQRLTFWVKGSGESIPELVMKFDHSYNVGSLTGIVYGVASRGKVRIRLLEEGEVIASGHDVRAASLADLLSLGIQHSDELPQGVWIVATGSTQTGHYKDRIQGDEDYPIIDISSWDGHRTFHFDNRAQWPPHTLFAWVEK